MNHHDCGYPESQKPALFCGESVRILKEPSKIKEEYLRIRLNIIIGESNYYTFGEILQIKEVMVRLPKPYLLFILKESERLDREPLIE